MLATAEIGRVSYAPNYGHDPFAFEPVTPSVYAFPPTHKPPLADNDNFPLPKVVALTGAAGSGKSTVADYLIAKHGYTRVKFAGPLKDMCRAIGMTDIQIEGAEKELPSDILCGRSPRYFMQRLGTDFGRDLIGEDFWINLWLRSANQVLANNGRVVTDDCRFDNEAEAVQQIGGIIIALEGRGGISGTHQSEKGITEPDFIIHNTGSIFDLKQRAEELLFSID